MSNKNKYIVKNLTPWMVDELIAISEISTYDLILLREPNEFMKESLDTLSVNGVSIYVKPFSYNFLLKKLLLSAKFIGKNLLNFEFNYNGIIGLTSLIWFLKFDLNLISTESNIHSQFATQASLLSLLFKNYYSHKPKISFTYHAYDIYFRNKWFDLLAINSRLIISISEFNIQYVKSNYQNTNNISLSRLGVFRKQKKEPKIVRSEFTLGLMSWFVRKKGIIYLLEAVKSIRDEGLYDFKLILAGDGPLKGEIIDYIEKNDLSHIVILTGKIKDDKKDEFYRSLDVFVLPSIKLNNDQDGIPVVMMEAISHSLPLISTNVSGIPEICLNNYNGLLVEERNSEKISEAIKFLYDNERERQIFSRNSYELSKNYDIRINSAKKVELLNWL